MFNFKKSHNKAQGFTLSEVLVTIAVLGILGAILIPTIMRVAPSKNKVLFRKAYATIQSTINTLINDDTNYPGDKSVTISSIAYPLGFNYTTSTSNALSGTTYNKFCYFLIDSLNTVSSGPTSCLNSSQAGNSYLTNFTTSDGIYWTLFVPIADSTTNALYAVSSTYPTYAPDSAQVEFPVNATQYTTKLILDVNGTTAGPNCTTDTGGATAAPYSLTLCSVTTSCASNPDKFIVGIRYDGRINVGITGSSDACANYILSNPTDNQK